MPPAERPKRRALSGGRGSSALAVAMPQRVTTAGGRRWQARAAPWPLGGRATGGREASSQPHGGVGADLKKFTGAKYSFTLAGGIAPRVHVHVPRPCSVHVLGFLQHVRHGYPSRRTRTQLPAHTPCTRVFTERAVQRTRGEETTGPSRHFIRNTRGHAISNSILYIRKRVKQGDEILSLTATVRSCIQDAPRFRWCPSSSCDSVCTRRRTWRPCCCCQAGHPCP